MKNNTKQKNAYENGLKPQNRHIEPNPQNSFILKQFIESKINKELKNKPQAQDILNNLNTSIIIKK